MWCGLAIFLVYFFLTWDGRMLAGHSPDWQLQSVVNLLIFWQCVLLFQEKDGAAYGWLAVMSLLQVVVAARYSRGVAFGSLLIAYTVVGMFVLSLLAMYRAAEPVRASCSSRFAGCRQAKRCHGRDDAPVAEQGGNDPARRWPLAATPPEFDSATPVSGRAGIVPELFARLFLIVAGGLLLSTAIFYTVPRPRIPFSRAGRLAEGDFRRRLQRQYCFGADGRND